MKRSYPFLVGVTGGLGSGKSTVCHLLANMGCALFEADRVAKEMQLTDAEVITGIKMIFGDGIYSRDADGDLLLDRKTIASIVFSSPEKLQALNQLIHPKVFTAFSLAIDDARQRGVKILVKEAAILFESGGSKGLDAVVVVTADEQTRIARAVLKGMGTAEEIARRLAAQWPQEKLTALADYVLINNVSCSELQQQSEQLYHTLLAAADAACG